MLGSALNAAIQSIFGTVWYLVWPHLQKAMVMGETRRETEAEAAPNQPETEQNILSHFYTF